MRILFGFLLFITTLSVWAGAYQYNDVMLSLHAKTAPKVAVMETAIEKKYVKNSLSITIVYDKRDETVAKNLKDMIGSEYERGVAGHDVVVNLREFREFSSGQQSTLVYILRGDADRVERVVEICKKHSILTFSYEPEYLQYGVILSLFVDKRTSPYINLKAAKESGISFKEMLLRISKIYGGEQ